MIWLNLITLLAIALVIYHHAGYPLLLARLARRRPAPPLPPAPSELPRITLLVAAYQEAAHTVAKIHNCAALDYPRDRLQVLIACDGCRDNTAALARQAAQEWWIGDLKVDVLDFPRNRGKVAVLNDAMRSSTGEIIVATDASALLSVDGLQRVARWFSDPQIGIVCATYRLMATGPAGEDAYWRIQTGVLRHEARFGAALGAHGAGYGFRRSAWQPLPPDTINDDFILPTRIIAAGYRGIYDDTIVALEMDPTSEAQSFRRRIRIGAGNLQQLVRSLRLIDPQRPALAWLFLSGKGLRPLMPLILLIALAGSLLATIDGSPWFAVLLTGQGLGYGLGLLAPWLPARLRLTRPVQMVRTIVRGHLAGLIGAGRYVIGLDRGRWRRV